MSDVIYDVAIVGGGLAGLNAAIRCEELGLKSIILEASDKLGGKLRTDCDAEGFRYDRGFQVCFTAYDEIPTWTRTDLSRDGSLRYFAQGASIVGRGTLSKWGILRSVRCQSLTIVDLVRLLLLNLRAQGWETYSAKTSTMEFLKSLGFSDVAIREFFVPFYGGVSLDRELAGSAKQFLKTWRYLSKGKTATFLMGIEELASLTESVYNRRIGLTRILECNVTALKTVDAGYQIATTELLDARAVIIAAGPQAATSILNTPFRMEYKQSICLYFASDQAVTKEKFIVLNPATDALVNQLVPLSNVNPACAPSGKHLCSATIIGERPESDEELAQMAIKEMNTWGMNLPPLEFKRAYRIKEAQLRQEPGFEDRVPSIETHLPGVFLAGEMTISSSINDALKSGRLAAEAALAYLMNK